MKMRGAERGRTEGCQRAVDDLRKMLAHSYRSFVAWGSLYGDLDLRYEQERSREEVTRLLDQLPGEYLARSMWIEQATRKKIERFIEKSRCLYADFVADIIAQGYPRTRAGIADRVSRELGPLKKEADAALSLELASPCQPRWRRRLR